MAKMKDELLVQVLITITDMRDTGLISAHLAVQRKLAILKERGIDLISTERQSSYAPPVPRRPLPESGPPKETALAPPAPPVSDPIRGEIVRTPEQQQERAQYYSARRVIWRVEHEVPGLPFQITAADVSKVARSLGLYGSGRWGKYSPVGDEGKTFGEHWMYNHEAADWLVRAFLALSVHNTYRHHDKKDTKSKCIERFVAGTAFGDILREIGKLERKE